MDSINLKNVLPTITSRELQVLKMSYSETITCKEIADRLGISEETIKKHRKNILKKYSVQGKTSFREIIRSL